MIAKVPLVAVALLASAVAAFADTAVKCTFKSLAACPKIGCAKPNSPTAATNSQKRTVSTTGTPAKISFDDLRDLQADVETEFPTEIAGVKIKSYRSMKAAPRKILLSGLAAGGKKFSEGAFVELSGFIAAEKQKPHPNKGETVNCKFTDEPRNDYHISITPTKNSDETKGVVVEMIPQNPHRKNNKEWNLDKLRKIQDLQLPVKIQGRLFFDSEHTKNTSKTSTSKQPRRFSLWEIHPVSSFFVCESGACASSGWKALEDWTPSS